MSTTPNPQAASTPSGMPANQVYVMAAICLLIGLALGYFLGGQNSSPPAVNARAVTSPGQPSSGMGNHPQVSLEQMKQQADAKAKELIEKLKADPQNAPLLLQIAAIYFGSHQFQEAANYYEQALKLDPKNVPARTELASCLYYSGDVDGALNQLNQNLKYKPNDVDTLFNLGMIRYQGKKDSAGAVSAWEQLLKTNPNLDRKPLVEHLIADAKSSTNNKSN